MTVAQRTLLTYHLLDKSDKEQRMLEERGILKKEQPRYSMEELEHIANIGRKNRMTEESEDDGCIT